MVGHDIGNKDPIIHLKREPEAPFHPHPPSLFRSLLRSRCFRGLPSQIPFFSEFDATASAHSFLSFFSLP